jgi:hypothetical protein
MEMNNYVEALQQTMQAAIAEAERLRDEALRDREAAADIRMETQALLNQYEHEANAAAVAAADIWLTDLHQKVHQLCGVSRTS